MLSWGQESDSPNRAGLVLALTQGFHAPDSVILSSLDRVWMDQLSNSLVHRLGMKSMHASEVMASRALSRLEKDRLRCVS